MAMAACIGKQIMMTITKFAIYMRDSFSKVLMTRGMEIASQWGGHHVPYVNFIHFLEKNNKLIH